MRKLIVTILKLGLATTCLSQTNTFPTSGNVGIGTTNPASKLHVVGGHIAAASDEVLSGFVQLWADNAVIWKNGNASGGLRFGSASNLAAGAWSEKMRISDQGNIGIGTTAPQGPLHILNNNNIQSILLESSSAGWGSGMILRNTASGGRSYGIYSAAWGGLDFVDNNVGLSRMFISTNGNIGIGTSNPQALLAVNGDIFSKKVKVMQTGWPDYVFSPTYKLMSLKELETYLDANRHLPDIPSAKEVNSNGLDLGETQAALLKKIEELTLYIIEQDKILEKVQNEMHKIKKQMNSR